MSDKFNIDIWDYFLIGLGILLLPIMGIGLIPIGIAVYRIGDKMEKHKKETDKFMEDFDKQTKWELEEMERKYKKYDIDYLDPIYNMKNMKSFSHDTLQEMK